jgi:hypothetical protein
VWRPRRRALRRRGVRAAPGPAAAGGSRRFTLSFGARVPPSSSSPSHPHPPPLPHALPSPRSQLENRKLAIDLAALLVRWEERRIREQLAAHPEDADLPTAPPAAAPPVEAKAGAPAEVKAEPGEAAVKEEGGGDAAAGEKRPREEGGDGGAEPPAKQAKGADGAPAAAAPVPAAPALPASAAPPPPRDGEYALQPQQADAVLHLLIRVAFVCADAPDREMQALRAYTLKVRGPGCSGRGSVQALARPRPNSAECLGATRSFSLPIRDASEPHRCRRAPRCPQNPCPQVFRQAAKLFKDAPIRLPWLEKLLQVRPRPLPALHSTPGASG